MKRNSNISSLLNQPAPASVTSETSPPQSQPATAGSKKSLKALSNNIAAKNPQSSYLNVFSIDSSSNHTNNNEEVNAAVLMTELRKSFTKKPAGPHVPQLSASFQFSRLLKYFTDSSQNTMPNSEHIKSHLTPHPTRLQLNRYLATYFVYFHPVLPFLHPHTFDPSTVAPPLLFGVCSIGALLCHENNMSVLLHNTCRNFITSIFEVSKDYPQNSTPLWTMQTLITALIYCSWSGDVRGLEFISSIRSTITTLVKTAVNNLVPATTPSEFLQTELTVRTYFAVFIVFGSLTAIFNYPSQINPSDIPQNTPLPCLEAFWNSEQSIHKMPAPSMSFQQAMSALRNKEQCGTLSPMAIRVLGTALFKECWQFRAEPWSPTHNQRKAELLDILVTWNEVAVDPEPGRGQSVSQFLLNSSPMVLALAVEELPCEILDKIRSMQHPLVVDAYVLALVMNIRMLVDMTAIRESLRFHVPHDISSAAVSTLSDLMSSGSLSSPAVTALVAKCFDIFRIIAVPGMRLFTSVSSSPIFVACPEALLCFAEITLLVVMWCHRYEHERGNSLAAAAGADEDDEASLYAIMERTCFESGLEKCQGRLATTLSLTGADMLEACDSWGFAELMSLALRSFAYQLGPTSAASGPTPTSQAQMPSLPSHSSSSSSSSVFRHSPIPPYAELSNVRSDSFGRRGPLAASLMGTAQVPLDRQAWHHTAPGAAGRP